jgi:O-antigen/teichoic acid export membrane protein
MGFLRGFSIAIGANAVLFLLSFLNNKLLYIELSRGDNGIFFLVIRFSMLIGLIFNEWMRITNINIAGQDKSLTPNLASNSVLNALCSSILLFAIVFFSPSAAAFLMPGLPVVFLLPVVLIGLSLMVRDSFQSLLLVNNRLKFYGSTTILWGVVFLTLDIIFVPFLHLGLKYVIIALFVASLSAAIWAFAGVAVLNGISAMPSLNVLKKSAKIGVRASVAVLGMFLMINIHTFTIEPFSGNSAAGLVAVGVFSVGFRIFQLYQRGADITSSILYSNVAQRDDNSGKWMALLVFRNIFFFSLFFSVLGGIFGKLVIRIIADKTYYDAYLSLIYMIPGIVFFNAGSVLNSYYWAKGYPLKIIAAPFFAAAAGFILDYFMIPAMGPEGAAISFSAAAIMWFVYILFIFKADSGHKLLNVLLPCKEDYYYLKTKLRARLNF